MTGAATEVFDRVLALGRRRAEGSERAHVDALCRQIDVRKRLDADADVVEGCVEVLLANASAVGSEPDDGAVNDGWGLKCLNSALKALDLRADLPRHAELRGRALDILARVRTAAGGTR
jgi:hypothetical protein